MQTLGEFVEEGLEIVLLGNCLADFQQGSNCRLEESRDEGAALLGQDFAIPP